MHRSVAKLLALLLTTVAVFSIAAHARQLQPDHAAGVSCLPRERDALLAFKQAGNDTYDFLASWQKRHKNCCRWRGVTCSNETGHVIELDIGGTDLDGKISPSLLSLKHLEYLNLNSTFLLGPDRTSLFPEFLCSLSNLRHLDLSRTQFSGRLPAQLANLSNLEYLDLSWTQFSGRLPAQLANLSNLEYLDLSNTSMSGILPPQLGNLSNLRHLGLSFIQDTHTSDISWLTHLHFLEYLDMSDINLSSADVFLVANTIPSLKALILINCSLPKANQTLTHVNLTKLEELDLSRNYLGHRIETCWFWNITSIKDLALVSTYLYGPFPDVLGGMISLQRLEFTNNGNSATMTVDLNNLCDLDTLWLDGSLAFANLTDFVMKLPQCSSSKLRFLSSSHNNMAGMLPDMVGHFTSLEYLYLYNNSITGAIPTGLVNCTSLESVNLGLNQLSGQMTTLQGWTTLLGGFLERMEVVAGRLGHLPELPLASAPMVAPAVGFMDEADVELFGSFSPRAGSSSTAPVLPDFEGEASAEVVSPVLKIMPELQVLCGEPVSPQPMEQLKPGSLQASEVALVPSPPPVEPCQASASLPLGVMEREVLDDVVPTSVVVVASKASTPVPGALLAKEICDFLVALEAADPGSGKTIGCLLKEKAIRDKKRGGASSRPIILKEKSDKCRSKKSDAMRKASAVA